jgi:hypothetical protein
MLDKARTLASLVSRGCGIMKPKQNKKWECIELMLRLGWAPFSCIKRYMDEGMGSIVCQDYVKAELGLERAPAYAKIVLSTRALKGGKKYSLRKHLHTSHVRNSHGHKVDTYWDLRVMLKELNKSTFWVRIEPLTKEEWDNAE